jgi:hypothetical protein
VIGHAILAVERDGHGWVVVMRDVSAALLPDAAWLSRAGSRRVLEAAAALHAAFPDPAVRAWERADLDWWTARARDALERWSP